MSISQLLLPEFDQEMENTRKMLACVPDGKWDWKPHEKSMSLGRLSGHIAELPSWGATMMETDLFELNPEEYKAYIADSPADLVETFEKHRAKAREAIVSAGDEAFQKTWTMKFGGKTVMSLPRVAVMRGMFMNHLIHHRAQLSVYLRLLDVPFPGMYGPTADEPSSLRTSNQNV
jgi:uncharacterized damage-inducible protein DinB